MIVPAPKVPDARTRNCVDYSAGCAFAVHGEREQRTAGAKLDRALRWSVGPFVGAEDGDGKSSHGGLAVENG